MHEDTIKTSGLKNSTSVITLNNINVGTLQIVTHRSLNTAYEWAMGMDSLDFRGHDQKATGTLHRVLGNVCQALGSIQWPQKPTKNLPQDRAERIALSCLISYLSGDDVQAGAWQTTCTIKIRGPWSRPQGNHDVNSVIWSPRTEDVCG